MKMLKPINKNTPLSLIYNLLNSVDYLVGDHKRHWIGEFQFLNVAIPSKENEQTAIANALSDVDALISELEKLIAKKQAIKTATMQQLLTGRTRLPQFALRDDGTPKGTKPSELGEIPEDWEVVELGKLLAYEQPTNYLISHTKFLDEGLYPVLTAGKSFILGYTNEEHGVFTNLPVIIFDDFTTDSKFVDFPFKAKSSAMKMLKPINKNTPLSLIYNLLNSVDYLVGDHKRHWIGEFQFLNVAIPSKENEQTAIANALSDVDALISELEKLIAKKQAIKTATMQQLLTGRTRLPQFALRDDGTPKGTKPSELGEIPEDWEVVELGKLLA